MIKNDRQYQVTRNHLSDFRKALAEMERSQEDPMLKELHTNALIGQIEDFEKDLSQYEQLKSGRQRIIEINALSSLSEILIKARIAKGWTQAELANKLEMKEQQIQRYESSDYAAASISRINEVAVVLGLEFANPLRVRIEDPFLVESAGSYDMEIERCYSQMMEIKNERGSLIGPAI